MVIGGILAGGLGTRMSNGGLPKQFLKIGGKPVIIRTLERFSQNKNIDRVVVAMNRDWIDYCNNMFAEYGIDMMKTTIICGGETRFESLLCLANECVRIAKEENDSDEIIMINHDCARPFVSDRILNDNITMVRNYDMVTTSVPTIDTVLVSKDGKVSDCVPDRPTIFLDQGPQTLEVNHFLKLVDTLTDKEKEIYMEAGRLYIDKGYRVGIVEGERTNFKLTTQFDLKLAELMLAEED
ncbi:MAG: 2-C-methyl-D-erythritol 4-phosphate cytidylyltransferase [Clostridia bacterium]|nr:2-C-methyl-D-erythritol 4-phosphate cytidylyltransferase [Clostridia bacterium]